MLERVRRALALDSSLYRTVADQPVYTTEAVIVAVVAAILGALGTQGGGGGAGGFFASLFNSLVFGWVVWAALAAAIANALGGRATFNEMLRSLGYANAPRAIALLGVIPLIGWIFGLIAGIWTIIAGIIAIREAAEFDTGRAIVTGIVGVLLFIVAGIVIGLILAAGALIF